MPVLSNVPSTDAHQEIRGVGSVRVTLLVANAAILYQIGRGRPVPTYAGADEVFAPPGFYSLERAADGLRFRSAVAGVPAQVTAQLLGAGELGTEPPE